MTDLAALGFAVDSSPLVSATQALKSMDAAATGAAASADKLNTASAASGAATGKVTAAIRAGTDATMKAADALARATTAHTAHAGAVGANAAQMAELIHVGRSMFDMMSAGIPITRALTVEAGRLGQIMSQGGLLSSFNGIVSRVAGFATPARLAAGGFLAIGAAAAIAAVQAQEANDKLTRALQGVGAATGLTTSGLRSAAITGAQRAGISNSAGFDIAAQLAGTGKITGDMIPSIIGTARQFGRITGQSTSDAGGVLASAFADPTKGADTLSKSLGFLDAATAHNIETLQRQGNLLGAQRALFDAYSGSLARATDTTWSLKKVWDSALGSASNFFGAIGSGIQHIVAPDTKQTLEAALKANSVAASNYTGRNPFIPDPASTTGPKVMEAWAAVMAENAKAARDSATQFANQRSFDASGIVRGNIGDIGRREDLSRSMTNLQSAIGDPEILAKMNVSLDAAKEALAGITSAFKNFASGAQLAREQTDASVKSILTRSDVERAQIEYEQKVNEARRSATDSARLMAEAEGKLATQRAESQRALQDLARGFSDQAGMYGLSPAMQQRRQLELQQRDFQEKYSAPSAAPTGSPMAILQSQLGKGAGDIQPFLGAGGQGLIAKFAAWCAAALNSALEQAGIHGSGSNLARSLLKVGTPVDTPQRGDIVVLSRGGANSGLGHTGFYDSTNPDGTIRVLGGNTGGRVGYGNFDPSKVLGYRHVGAGGANDNAAGVFSGAMSDLVKEQTTGFNSPLAQANRDLETQAGALNAQKAAWGQSEAAIAAAAEKQRLMNEYTQQFGSISPDVLDKIDEEAKRFGALKDAQEKAADAVRALDDARSALRDSAGTFASDLLHGASAATALHDALSRLADRALNSALDGLFNSILGKSGSSGGILGSLFGGIFGGGGSIPGAVSAVGASSSIGVFASGTDYAPGGLSLVGEKGPELVNLPRGSSVITNDNLRNGNWGSRVNDNSRTYHIDARGAQPGVGDQIVSALKAYDGELDRTIGVKYANWHQNN